jgi:holliday junction DNA helicase RuvA
LWFLRARIGSAGGSFKSAFSKANVVCQKQAFGKLVERGEACICAPSVRTCAAMIGRLRGVVLEDGEGEAALVIDVRGVGYEVIAPLGTLGRLAPDAEGNRTFFVHTHVREDAFLLFAFASEADRFAFRQLISVSSIGPKTAIGILSALPGPELGLAVQRKELAKLTAISGIGKKTAERMLLELQDKIPTMEGAGASLSGASQAATRSKSAHSGNAALVANALIGMGYKSAEADRALAAFEATHLHNAELPQLLREALAYLSK